MFSLYMFFHGYDAISVAIGDQPLLTLCALSNNY
jgi:hypothetical protein